MLINATSRSSGPQTAGPTPHERGRRAFSYGAGPVGWGPELREVALIKISLSFAYRTIDYRFVVFIYKMYIFSPAVGRARIYCLNFKLY